MKSAAARDYASWRPRARGLLAEGVPPEEVGWYEPGRGASLFAHEAGPGMSGGKARIARALAELLEACSCHADPERWALMYRVLWRVVHGGERHLVQDAADADMLRIRRMARAVDREVHKMHAFVRFRETQDESGESLYVAWFEPEHDILRRAAPFFRDRFASMRWLIATPRGAARWDGSSLAFSDLELRRPVQTADEAESLWRTYYSSIFNPARLNESMMAREMPRRYWKDLPEAQDIARLSRDAAPRVAAMQATTVVVPRWSERVAVPLDEASGVHACRRCPLWEHATQAVEGRGPRPAALMVVGEQPGDEEDLKGEPFVGPAGRVFERALAEAGIARDSLYVTNAVKHFKWQLRGKRRIHKTPAQREILACAHWLEEELEAVKPRAILAMGASAAFALTGSKLGIAASRGADLGHRSGASLVVTYHPSAVLRAQENAARIYAALVEDLVRARGLA